MIKPIFYYFRFHQVKHPVKTFSEIMREKQLHKRNMAENPEHAQKDGEKNMELPVDSKTRGGLSPPTVDICLDFEEESIVAPKKAASKTAPKSNVNPVETTQNDPTKKRKVRRTVWSTRDTVATPPASQNEPSSQTRKLTINRQKPSSRDLGVFSQTADNDDKELFTGDKELFTGKKSELFTGKKIAMASRLGARLDPAAPTAGATKGGGVAKGRSPFMRNKDITAPGASSKELSSTSSISAKQKEPSNRVPISPIVMKSTKPKLSQQITPIGLRTLEPKRSLAKQITPIGIRGKTQQTIRTQKKKESGSAGGASGSTEWKRPDFLSVKIPPAAQPVAASAVTPSNGE